MIDNSQILTTNDICQQLKISRCTLERWEREGRIPPRQYLGSRRRGLQQSVLTDWLQSRPTTPSKQS